MKNINFYKRVALIAFPVILQQIINMSVNLCDGIMVGQLKETAISGVSAGNQFYLLFNILCMGLGGGTAVLVNQLWGKQEIVEIKKAITIMIRLCIGIASVFMLLSLFGTQAIVKIFSNNPEVCGEAEKYLRTMSFAYIIHGLGLTLSIVYRSVGVVWLSLISSAVSFGLNIFFNWVFIFGKLGFEPMGVKGAALGTVIARAIEFIVIAGYVLFRDKRIGYRISYLKMKCSSISAEYKRYALPVVISDVMLQLGNNLIAIIMGHMKNSEIMMAANNVTTITVQISTFFILGLSNAASIIVGNTIGEGKKQEAFGYGKKFLYISIVVGIIAAGLIELLNPIILKAYVLERETIECTKQLVNAISCIVVFQSVSSVLTKGVLRGGGDTRFLMVADVLFLWITAAPLGFLCGIVLELSSFWVYFVMKIDLVIKAVWCTYRLYKGTWARDCV